MTIDTLAPTMRGLLDDARRVRPLCVLDADEEATLGLGRWGTLVDADLADSWARLDESERRDRSAAAIGRLTARALLVPSVAGGRPPAPDARLALVDNARRSAPVLVFTEFRAYADQPWRATPTRPLGYAVVDQSHGVRAVLLEIRGGGSHDYRLATPQHAAEELAGSLVDTLRSLGAPPPRGAASTLTVVTRSAAGVTTDRLVAQPDGPQALLTVHTPAETRELGTVTLPDVADAIGGRLAAAVTAALGGDTSGDGSAAWAGGGFGR